MFAFVIAACDDGGGAPPPGPTTGAVRFAWTVGGQPAVTACPAGAQVTIESTSGTTPVNKMASCDAGMLFVTDLKPGAYVFNATLTGGAMKSGINATVTVGTVTTADPIDFAAAQASLRVSWTVNGGMRCTATAMVTAEAVLGGTISALQAAPCGDYQTTLSGLAAGTYTVDLLLSDGSMMAPAELQNVTVQAGPNMAGPIDITCSFCP